MRLKLTLSWLLATSFSFLCWGLKPIGMNFKVTQCKDCLGGYFCDMEAATNVTGVCMQGFYCESGVDRANPNNAEVNSTWPPSCPLLGGHTGTK